MGYRAILTRQFLKEDIEYLSSRADDWEFVVPERYDDKSFLAEITKGIDIFIGTPPSRTVLAAAKSQLKLLQIPWTGVEQIDFNDCLELGVSVANSHGNSYAVAEMAMSLLFSALKKIPYHDRELRNGEWHRPGSEQGFFAPRLLRDLTIGYFGYGSINKNINKMLTGFDIEHIAISRNAKQSNINVMAFSDMDIFLEKADIIIIAAPLTSLTEGLFDKSVFAKMKSGSIIINVARAKIIEQAALIENLNSGHLAGAALDVWYQYPSRGDSKSLPCDTELLSHPNLIASPHRSGFVKGELPHLADVITNLRLIENNEPPINLVNLEHKY